MTNHPAGLAPPVTTPKAPTIKRQVSARRRREMWIGFAFVVPGVALVIAFKLIPLVRGIQLSFLKTVGFSDPTFAGFDNYSRLFSDPAVIASFRNALILFATLPFWILLPLILAVLIFQRSPGWKFFRAAYFVPYMVAPIIVGIMFRQILAPDGPLNILLRSVGLAPLATEWLNGQTSALLALAGVALWSFFGLGVLTYLSGLATISDEVIEAARLDGAGFWRLLAQIILPMIKPIVGYWTVLCTSGILIWMFPLIYALTKGGPGYSSMMPEYLVFITTFQFLDRGYGAAIGIALFVVVALISALVIRYMYAQSKEQKEVS